MSWGDPANVAGSRRGAGRPLGCAARPGIPARAPPPPRRLKPRVGRALTLLELEFMVLSPSPPPFFPLSPSPVTFSPNRKVMCKPSFAAGDPRSPLSDSRSLGGMRCLQRRRPEGPDGAPSAAPRTGPLRRLRRRSARGPRPAPPEAAGRSELSGPPSSPRVQGHPGGWIPQRWERVLPGSDSSPESGAPCRSRHPFPWPACPRWAAGLPQGSRSALAGPGPGPTSAGSPKSYVEAPPGKEVRLPLHAAPSGI